MDSKPGEEPWKKQNSSRQHNDNIKNEKTKQNTRAGCSGRETKHHRPNKQAKEEISIKEDKDNTRAKTLSEIVAIPIVRA
eukprot:14181782-Heterocapsa_arctica.AAC.1